MSRGEKKESGYKNNNRKSWGKAEESVRIFSERQMSLYIVLQSRLSGKRQKLYFIHMKNKRDTTYSIPFYRSFLTCKVLRYTPPT